MTASLLRFDSSNWPPREGGKRLTGKYLQLLEAFARSLVMDADSFLVNATPEYNALTEALAKVFWEHLTPENIQTIIFRQCMYFEVENAGRVGSLSAPENKDLLDELVTRLKSFFESIPRECTLRIELPSMHIPTGSIRLSDDVSLVGSVSQTVSNMLASNPASATYLEVLVEGYGDTSAESPAASAALSIAKQFAFVAQVFGVVKTNYMATPGASLFRDSAYSDFAQMTIPEGARKCFSRLKVNPEKLVMYDWLLEGTTPRSLLSYGAPPRSPEGEKEIQLALNHLLTDVRRFFSARSNEDFEPIAAAIEWYQDSMFADNDTFAYIAACIGLEAVLGSADEQLDSLSKRLADRYAFLMGKGRKEREALRKDYGDVLKLRGRLVHGKAARINSKERPLLGKVQDLLLQLLWKEILRILPAKLSI